MSNILVFVQFENNKLNPASLSAINAASQLKKSWSCSKIIAVCLGAGAAAIAKETANYCDLVLHLFG